MTRLLQAMAGAEHGGAEAFFERLALALERAGVEQRAVIRRNPRRAGLLRAGGLAVTELAFGGLLDFSTRPGLRRAIADFRPQVVLTWMNRATRMCPISGPGSDGFVHVGRLGGYYDLRNYRHCHHLIGNTQDICRWIVAQGWSGERVHYVPNFVSEDVAEPMPRARLATPAGMPLALTLGRLHPNKGFDVLIRALASLPALHLWIAGEGPLEAELKALAEQSGVAGRVRFLGWRDDVPALFAAADLFICPSRHEPLGNVVIEAWAQGLPVIAAAAQGPRELIEDECNGLLVPIDDSAALAAAVNRLLGDPAAAAALGARGRRAYESRFTESAVVARYLDFLAKVSG